MLRDSRSPIPETPPDLLAAIRAGSALAWPDNDCTVGRTCLWGRLTLADLRRIRGMVPHASFTPTFASHSWDRGPDGCWAAEFFEREGQRLGFYVNNLTADDVAVIALFFGRIGPCGGACG